MSHETVDAAALAFRFILGCVFLSAAVPKLVNRGEFRRAVSNYGLLPPRLVTPAALAVPALELACAIALLLGVAVRPVGSIAAALLAGFAIAVATNLLRGRTIDCGCTGSVAPRAITWQLVVSDLALAGMAIVAAVVAPDVLAIAPFASPSGATALAPDDGVAILVLGSALVLIRLLVSSWRAVHPLTKREAIP
jgi:uncharacterized membrane protein YphA (DoxX/SURF4 family)